MKNTILIFILAVVFNVGNIACRPANPLVEKLTGTKYWDWFYFRENGIIGCYAFSKDGSCKLYTYSKSGPGNTLVLMPYNAGDVEVPQTWKLTGDSILNIQGIAYTITGENKDSIMLRNQLHTDSLILINSAVNDMIHKHKP